MFRRWRHHRRCRNLVRKCSESSLAAYLEECPEFDIDRLDNTPLISVDLELTGLDPRENQIIAIGWTHVDDGRIRFAANRQLLINAGQSVGDSAAIHELLDSDVADGAPLEIGLRELFEAGRGRVWLFHHAGLDVAFLQQACISWAGVAPPFVVLDTMQMELAMRKRQDLPLFQDSLRLSRLRESYKLPRYTAHNALVDACATAELLLAIADRLEPATSLRLSSHIKYF